MSDPFSDVIGHAGVLQVLRLALPRPHHAYVLVGAPGVGAHAIAERFVRALTDASPDQPLQGHPDIAVLTRGGEETTSATISVEAVRELRGRVARRPVVASRVVAYLPEADRLNEAGANALLKSMEEPPAGCVFVLVASDLSRLPATIRSRSVVLNLGLVPMQAINGWLIKQGWKNEGERQLALEYAAGKPGHALAWLQETDRRVEGVEQARTIEALVAAAQAGDAMAAIEADARRAEAAADPLAAWQATLDGLMHALRPQFAESPVRALVIGQALATARRRLGGPVSPRIWLELQLAEGLSQGPSFPQPTVSRV